jgi:sigma-B regulation protein RsbU (phosphoserine phosphatase)
MYIFTDGITEIKNSEGKELESEGFQKYIIKFKDKPINERLKLIVDNILNSKYIQKDDLTIAVIESK